MSCCKYLASTSRQHFTTQYILNFLDFSAAGWIRFCLKFWFRFNWNLKSIVFLNKREDSKKNYFGYTISKSFFFAWEKKIMSLSWLIFVRGYFLNVICVDANQVLVWCRKRMWMRAMRMKLRTGENFHCATLRTHNEKEYFVLKKWIDACILQRVFIFNKSLGNNKQITS